jgi:P pilus assembly protein, porin PapC
MQKAPFYQALKFQVRQRAPLLHCTHLTLLISIPATLELAFQPSSAFAQEYFNPHALEMGDPGQKPIDLEYFANQGGQLPGLYSVDIYLNDNRVAHRDVNFVSIAGTLQPELTSPQLQEMGVKLEAFPALQQLPSTSAISTLSDYIPYASSRFDFKLQRLDISIPQAALTSQAHGYVDPQLWDQGLSAALLNYSFSGSNTLNNNSNNRSKTNDSYYLNLRSGLNLGAWRLRNYSTYNSRNGNNNWQNLDTYAQKDIQSLKGQLTLGDSSTPSDVFNSVLYRGIQLNSDDNMYPDSLKGFAPVVRGIAQSNAQVTVRQNGYIIYQTYVSAGAFTITDLYPTSSSGDLEIAITESDGTVRRSTQSFSAVPVMLREGRLKYSVTAGQYRSNASAASKPSFMQSTLIYGLPYDYTLYGGLLASGKYNATTVGIGHTLEGWGRYLWMLHRHTPNYATGPAIKGSLTASSIQKPLTPLTLPLRWLDIATPPAATTTFRKPTKLTPTTSIIGAEPVLNAARRSSASTNLLETKETSILMDTSKASGVKTNMNAA